METRLKIMKSMIGKCQEKKVLEIGIMKPIMSHNYCNLTTLDVDDELNPMIKHDLNDTPLPFKSQEFDIIIFGEVIEHLISPVNFLNECCRILKDEGHIVLSTPNTSSLKNRVKALFGKLPEHCAAPTLTGRDYVDSHLKDFNFNKLKQVLSHTGFKIVQHSSNGIRLRWNTVFPLALTPTSFGECLIMKCIKIEKMYQSSLYNHECGCTTKKTLEGVTMLKICEKHKVCDRYMYVGLQHPGIYDGS